MNVTRLPRTTRLFLVGNTVSMVGTGLVLPFLLIYLHQVRGSPSPWWERSWPVRPSRA